MSDDPRRRLGYAGEQLAADHLARRGFRILERNFRTRWGELDIIATNGRSIVFCELKYLRAPLRLLGIGWIVASAAAVFVVRGRKAS